MSELSAVAGLSDGLFSMNTSTRTAFRNKVSGRCSRVVGKKCCVMESAVNIRLNGLLARHKLSLAKLMGSLRGYDEGE